MPVILATKEAGIWSFKVQSLWANSSQDLISKITRGKWTGGGVAQVVEHSSPCHSLTHKKKKKKSLNLSIVGHSGTNL
jgi:hypothetical protein